MKPVLRRLAVMLLVASASGCAVPDMEEFATEYIKSVNEGTKLYLKYTPTEKLEEVENSRLKMSVEFEITRGEYYGNGQYEYYFRFDNGVTGTVQIWVQEGGVKTASLGVRDPRR